MKYTTFEELIRGSAEEFGDQPAIQYNVHNERAQVTYRQAADAVQAKVNIFRGMDFECLGICETGSPSWMLNVFASAIAGKRTVLLNSQQKTEYLIKDIRKCGVDYLLCSGRPDAEKLRYEADQNRAAHRARKEAAVPGGFAQKADDRAQLQAAQEEKAARKEIEDGGKLLVFTSGTTEGNRAAVLSQEALLRSAWNGGQMLHCGPGDIILNLLPLHHIFGFVTALLWPVEYGACVAIGRGIHNMRTDPLYYEPTIICTVPSILQYLLSVSGLNEDLRALVIGGGPTDESVLRAAAAKGLDVRFGYGMTETASGIAMNLAGDDPFAMTLCPEVTARVDADRVLYLRTPCMMDGYYHDPEGTEDVLYNGELNTGDLAEFDQSGRLHILGREKDILITQNGNKIFCPEWERKLGLMMKTQVALTLHGNMLVCVAVGNERYRSVCQEKIDEFNRTCPRGLEIRQLIMRDEPFPRTASGKIIRREL